jgi:hypothetical protein
MIQEQQIGDCKSPSFSARELAKLAFPCDNNEPVMWRFGATGVFRSFRFRANEMGAGLVAGTVDEIVFNVIAHCWQLGGPGVEGSQKQLAETVDYSMYAE